MPILMTNGKYEHTQKEDKYLQSKGFQPVESSNVSAIARKGEILFVRFHGGATYAYPTSGDLYDSMLNASSKGKFVWNELRRAGVPYYRVSNVNIQNDVGDKDMMKPTAAQTFLQALALTSMLTAASASQTGIIASLALANAINQGNAA